MSKPIFKFIILLITMSLLIACENVKNSSSLAQSQYRKGLIFDDGAYNKVLLKAPLSRRLYVVQARASLKQYSPTPKSQGSYGTCTGWATAYSARTISHAKRNGWTNKKNITEQAFSPAFVYHLIKSTNDDNCSGGSVISTALEKMKSLGVPKHSEFKQQCPSNIPNLVYDKAAAYKIKDYVRLFDKTDPNKEKIDRVRKSISEAKPVIIGMNTPDSFQNPRNKFWQPAANEDPTKFYGGHAMTVISYDEDKYGGAFEIQNSWGTKWGNGGYIWIKYQDFANFTKYAFELIDEPKAKPVSVPDLSGKVKFVLASGTEMQAKWMGEHYKIKDAYSSGTRFRLYLSNNEPAYVYAFASDLTGEVYPIFPHKKGISPALTYKGNEVAIPDEDHYIAMDDTVGSDFLCVLYAKEELDIEAIRQGVAAASGDFVTKVKKALGNQSVIPSDIKYTKSTIEFSAVSHGKIVVPLIVETKHL